jgi:hypothetical protein
MLKWAFALILILAIGGCQKQSPDFIESDYEDSLSDSLRGESCRNTELTNDLLEAKNLKNLFECTKWSEKFPAMYQSLVEMDQDAWNYFANPINEKIFNDKDLRDQLIELLNELDRLGGLAELGKVINSLSESNFYHNLYEIIKCAEDEVVCPGGKKISKEDLLSFFNFFELGTEDLSNFSDLTKGFSLAIGNASNFPNALRKELSKPQFFRTRLELLDQLFVKIGSTNFTNDLVFYSNILNEKDDDGGIWLRQIFQRSILAEDFDYLVFYPVDVQKNLWKDFRLLNVAIQSDLVCNPVGEFNGLRIDVSEHMTAFLYDLFNSSQEKFFQKTIQSVGLIKTATQMCRELGGYSGDIRGYMAENANMKHEMDFVNALTSSSRLLLHKGFYELFKKFQFSHPLGGARELFMLENFSDDFFISFLRMVETLNRGNQGPVFTGHKLLQSFDDSFYESLSQTVRWAQSKSPAQFASLSRVWSALSEEGKLFFINFFDVHYKNEANVSLLVAYYASTLKVANIPLSELLARFFSRKTKEEEAVFLRSMSQVTKILSAPELLSDFERFFSREHILEIMKIISRGYVSQEPSAQISDIYILEPQQREPLPQVTLSNQLTTVTEKCLSRMSEPQVSFYSLISVPPTECSIFAGEDPLMKSFFALSDFSYFLSDQGGVGLTREGIMSPVLLNNYVSLFKGISEKYTSPGKDGLHSILISINKFFQDRSARNQIQSFGKTLNMFAQDGGLVELASSYFGQDENYDYVSKSIEGVEIAATLFNRYKKGYLKPELGPTLFKEDSRYKCKDFHQELGGRSCPSSTEANVIAKRLVKRALKKNDEFPSALEQMLKMISVDHGLMIPYEGEAQRKKIVTIEESLRMFYGFTDPQLEINQTELEMQIYPAAVDDYFENEDWEVTRDQADSELKGIKKKLNTMERVEVVVRDVRFDELYLGAHYMNSVAKAEDYNKIVESKFGLLKKCVPLKFCGKFMNKAQHGLAKNSRDAFPSLLDANTVNGWRHGDYMQALLTSLVSSSPRVAQVSSVIRKKILGLKIDVPYLQTKKQLKDHNGKILGLVSMVSGFSNLARIVRDRTGRTDEEFQEFLQSDKLRKVSASLLKNYDPGKDATRIAEITLLADTNGLIESVINYFSEAGYQRQRLAENIIYKGLYLVSFLTDGGNRYSKLGLSSFLGLAKVVVGNHENISKLIDFKDLENLKDMNHFFDVATYELSRTSSPFIKLVGEFGKFVTDTESKFLPIVESYLSDSKKLGAIKEGFLSLKSTFNRLIARDDLMSVVTFIKEIRVSDKIRLGGFKNLLKLSGAKKVCEAPIDGDALICRNNRHQNEFGRALVYLTNNNSKNLLGIVDYFGRENDEDQLSFFLKIFPSLTIN